MVEVVAFHWHFCSHLFYNSHIFSQSQTRVKLNRCYIIAVAWALVICLIIATWTLVVYQSPRAQPLGSTLKFRACISGKLLVPMLQL